MTARGAGSSTEELLANNRAWVQARLEEDPEFFRELARGQSPPYLVFGCSDSRKCLNTMVGTRPGELFIHRNIGNQVPLGDPNVQAVLEFALLRLQVKHVVVGGHTSCSGMEAALEGDTRGAVGAWLRPVRELAARHDGELLTIPDRQQRADRLSELNVVAQMESVLRSPAYREARTRGRAPELRGWIFELGTGYIKELELPRDAWKAAGLL